MRKTSFSTVCVLALLVAGCQNSDDDNRGLEYDTLRVNFKGSMTNGTWETGLSAIRTGSVRAAACG